jgi:Fic family protein
VVADFQLLSFECLNTYKLEWKGGDLNFADFGFGSAIGSEQFQHYLIQSSFFSSKIEGNGLEINSFFHGKGKKDHPRKKEIKEIEDLVLAYQLAVENPLNQVHFLKAHALLSSELSPKKERGNYRKVPVVIRDSESHRPVYLAVEPEFVEENMDKLFSDIYTINQQIPDVETSFYFASMLHHWIAMIHPFGDGNGRIARLVEKWFLASVFGKKAWSWPTEKFYWTHRERYYREIGLGFNFYALIWDRCLPFLKMLPEAVFADNKGINL